MKEVINQSLEAVHTSDSIEKISIFTYALLSMYERDGENPSLFIVIFKVRPISSELYMFCSQEKIKMAARVTS